MGFSIRFVLVCLFLLSMVPSAAFALDFDLALRLYTAGPYDEGTARFKRGGVFVVQDYRALHFRLEVTNIGSTISDQVSVRMNAKNMRSGAFETGVEVATVRRLGAGETVEVLVDVEIPVTVGHVSGVYRNPVLFYLSPLLLPTTTLPDLDDTNNYAYRLITAAYFLPDYTIELTEVHVSEAPYYATAIVRNDGPSRGEAASLLEIFTDGHSTDGGMMDALDAGEERVVDFELGPLRRFYDELVPSDYRARVDALNDVEEWKEGNNDSEMRGYP